MTDAALPSPAPGAARRPRARLAAWVLLLVLAGGWAHAPALHGGFIWDDDAHITAPALRGTDGLLRIWFEPGATQQYYPLLHTAFWVEHRLWGDAAFGYHAVSLGLHLLAAILFARLLEQLAVRGAWLAALLFVVHPVHVESVAWISEQKNTLSLVCYLGAALAYHRFEIARGRHAYGIALALFLLGLCAKTIVATLPAALLVVAWWRRGRIGWRDVAPLLPWLACGAAAGLYTAWFERALIGAAGAAFDLTWLQRALLAPRVVAFYFEKLLWPAGLTFSYPRWTIDPRAWTAWLPLAALLGVTLFLLRWRAPAARAVRIALLLFVGSLFPVLGFLNVYPFVFSFVADHFQYLASLSLFALAGAGLAQLAAPRRVAGLALGLLVPLAWMVQAHQQSADYRDVETLYRATLARNPDSWMVLNNLGQELMRTKARLPEAIACFERALALRPVYPEAENNLGLALVQSGQPRAALPHLERAVRLNPKSYQTHNNLGIALASSGRADDALPVFAAAAALNPSLPNIHENWAKALLLLDRRAEAEAHFARAARLRAALNASSHK